MEMERVRCLRRRFESLLEKSLQYVCMNTTLPARSYILLSTTLVLASIILIYAHTVTRSARSAV